MSAFLDVEQAVLIRQAEIQWLNQCDARLRRAAAEPTVAPVPEGTAPEEVAR